MSCSTPIGVTSTGGAVTARRLNSGGHQQQLTATLRNIRQHPYNRHAAAVPACDRMPS